MNIDELLKLPTGPSIGVGQLPLTVLDRIEAKKQPTYNRIVLVDRSVEATKQSIPSLQNLESSGMKNENVLAISGLATLEILKNPSQQTELSKYLFMLPMGYNYTDISEILPAQILFIVVFQHLFYLLKLADTKDVPLFSDSFEKRYNKVRELLSKEQSADMIFSVPANNLRIDFWKAVNESLGIEDELSFHNVIEYINDKTPKELDAYFNSLLAPGEAAANNMSTVISQQRTAPRALLGNPRISALVTERQSVITSDPNNGASGNGNDNAASSIPSSGASGIGNNNNNAMSTIASVNLENNSEDTAIKHVVHAILTKQKNLYENFVSKNIHPQSEYLKVLYDIVKKLEKQDKKSYDAAIKEYTTQIQPPKHMKGGRHTLKNRKKINYTY